MYEERERFSFKDVILQIILVVLFVFLLLWLFPTKGYVDKKVDSSLQPLYNQIFSQNVNSMKEAAISYFTTSRLPKNKGDKVSLTLSEMLDKKLLIPFLDSNSKQCDLTESYVEMTKMDDEYILKVNLSCSDNSDYILVHLGCYSYCETGLCEKKETVTQTTTTSKPVVKPMVTKKYEYEYEKVTDGKWGEWSDWSEWSTAIAQKTDYRNVRTKQETVVIDTETIKVGTLTKVTDADSKVVYGDCPKGYTKSTDGKSCTRNVTTTDAKDATAVTNTTYNCNAYPGYTLSGNKCVKNTTSTDTKDATAVANYNCPAGWDRNGTVCSTVKSVVSGTRRGSYIDTITGASSVPANTATRIYVGTGADRVRECAGCTVKWVYTYDIYYAIPTYTDKTVYENATMTYSYNCSAYPGYTLSGNKCIKNVSSTDTKNATAVTNTTYNCNAYPGYNLNGNKCTKQVTTTQTIKNSSNTVYSCKVGDLVGKSCISYEDKFETFNKYSTITYYSYQEREYISGDRKVVWSRSQNDKTLINDGYILTGKSREI